MTLASLVNGGTGIKTVVEKDIRAEITEDPPHVKPWESLFKYLGIFHVSTHADFEFIPIALREDG